jgi:twitching motility protein PilT
MDKGEAVKILSQASHIKASDIHLSVFSPPIYRVNGELVSNPEDKILTPEDIRIIGTELMAGETVLKRLEAKGQVDFSNSINTSICFRANIYRQRGLWAIAIRLIPTKIPTIEELCLPPIVTKLAGRDFGMILITGPAGSGKSTTMAAMIDYINSHFKKHIITLEDPIEYLHQNMNSIISQREIGSDTESFGQALRAVLRQDPDVVVIGEMRDMDTIQAALTLADTGHLVIATLHAGSAVGSIERIVHVFPAGQQHEIRLQLAASLQGIITQKLLAREDKSGRAVAVEVLVATAAIKNLIRENRLHQIYSAMQTGQSRGMVTMENSIWKLYSDGIIGKRELEMMFRQDIHK